MGRGEAVNDQERYEAAVHAMQTGVGVKMASNTKETQPKHLRVGVNAAMCDHTALVQLLIERGVFSKEEYLTAIADEMEAEVERYQQELPPGVTLA